MPKPKTNPEILSTDEQHSLVRILAFTGDTLRAESEDEIPNGAVFKLKMPKDSLFKIKGKFSVVSCEEISEGGNFAVNLKRA